MALKLNKNLSKAFAALIKAKNANTVRPKDTRPLDEQFNDFMYWALYDYTHNIYNQSQYDFSQVINLLRAYIDEIDDDE